MVYFQVAVLVLIILAKTGCGSNLTTTIFSTSKLVDKFKNYDICLKLSYIVDYLIEQELCNQLEQPPIKVELLTAKNFNLLVTLPGNRRIR